MLHVILQKSFGITGSLRYFLSLDASVCWAVSYLGSRNAWVACSLLDRNASLHSESAQGSQALLVWGSISYHRDMPGGLRAIQHHRLLLHTCILTSVPASHSIFGTAENIFLGLSFPFVQTFWKMRRPISACIFFLIRVIGARQL